MNVSQKDLGSDRTRRARRDALFLAAIGVIVFSIGYIYDFPPILLQFAMNYADWQSDNAIVSVLVLSLFLLIYCYRRYRDLAAEINARVVAEKQAHRLARHDPLTGLPNRRYFEEVLAERIAPLTDERMFAVVLLDLNGFKPINDTHGHAVGDEVLQTFATRLSAILRSGSFLARLGGDEFAIVKDILSSPDEVAHLGSQIIGCAEEPIVLAAATVTVGICVGISMSPNDGTSAHDLLRRSDRALYRAKASGRSSVCFFEQEMDMYFDRRIAIERQLRKAVDTANDEIRPYYQPLISLADGAVVGFEALARWTNCELGEVEPEIFISIAEETKLIHQLGEVILQRACHDAKSWPQDFILAINVSAIQLKETGFGLRVLSILAQAGLSPHRLEVEITETAMIDNIDQVRATIANLREAGVRVALDDFGTGYATLSQLCSLQIDKIKIDKSFVAKLFGPERGEIIVKAILGLANGFGLATTAEGVEHEPQRLFLKENGCSEGQGFLFSKALTADEARSFVNLPVDAYDDRASRA